MSWPFLIYLIDVLSTDGTYTGWGFLMFLSGFAFVCLYAFQRAYEHEKLNPIKDGNWSFFDGQTLTLTQPFLGYPVGTEIQIVGVWNSDKTVKVKFPDNRHTDCDVSQSTIAKVTTMPKAQVEPVPDVTKVPRRIAAFTMVLCLLGILYANFMPQKETSYKMLAAYIGQNVVESPRTQQLADSTIKYLDAQIQKYTKELDAAAKADQAEKAKEKESK